MDISLKFRRKFYPLLIIGISVTIVIVSCFTKALWIFIGAFCGLIIFFIFSNRINWCVLSLILILASYINLIKPIFGIRYSPILVDLIIVLLFIKIFFNKIISEKHSLFISPEIEIPLLLFFLISVVQIFNPNIPSLQIGLEGFRKTTFQMIGIFLGIYFIRDSLEVEKISKHLCFASIPILLYGIKQWFFFSSFDQKIIDTNLAGFWTYTILGKMRAISIFSGPFHFGMFSCIFCMLSLFFYQKKRRIFYLVLFAISLLGVIFSMTRTNIVALILSCLFFLWFVKPEKRRLVIKIGICSILILIILAVIFLQNFLPVKNVLNSFKNISKDQRFLGRFRGYEKMAKAFNERPILGYGMGSAGDTLKPLFEGNVHFTSHNLGFKILIETGLLGLGIYIFFFLLWFKKAFNLFKAKTIHIKNLSVLITSIVLVLLVNGIVGSAVEAYPINLYIWFFMGTLVKIWWLEKNHRAEEKIEEKK